MQHKVMKSAHRNPPRRVRVPTPPAGQYSLFAAAARTPEEDARHFERQAQLCQRLLSSVHQPDLVEFLGRLHEEFEAKAAHAGAARPAADAMADDFSAS
jgi:hypothetical protein